MYDPLYISPAAEQHERANENLIDAAERAERALIARFTEEPLRPVIAALLDYLRHNYAEPEAAEIIKEAVEEAAEEMIRDLADRLKIRAEDGVPYD